jgi:hypothetical protein
MQRHGLDGRVQLSHVGLQLPKCVDESDRVVPSISGIQKFAQMNPAVRQYVQLERTGARDASGKNGCLSEFLNSGVWDQGQGEVGVVVRHSWNIWGVIFLLAKDYNTADAVHFLRPLNQYLPKKKVKKLKNLLSDAEDEHDQEEDHTPDVSTMSYYHSEVGGSELHQRCCSL